MSCPYFPDDDVDFDHRVLAAPMPFDLWLARVNQHLWTVFGLETGELPDIDYADLFRRGLTPAEASLRVWVAARGEEL